MTRGFPLQGMRGRVREGVPLAPRTTWRIGGPARWMVEPADRRELAWLLSSWPAGLPLLIRGGGSNLLVDDAGFRGGVVNLTAGLTRVEVDGAGCRISAEGGARVAAVAHGARRAGLGGVEFLAGIPGTVGGAVRMNAGAYGGEVARVLAEVELLDPQGGRHVMTPARMGMAYREGGVPAGWVVTRAVFNLEPGDPEGIRERIRANNRLRRLTQPLEWPSAGSVFKNPKEGPRAWELIDAAGMRGERWGAAQVSEKHCNFLINRGGAGSGEMRRLIDRVREGVVRASGTFLELEVKLLTPTGVWEDRV